jgi:hypothetical protein
MYWSAFDSFKNMHVLKKCICLGGGSSSPTLSSVIKLEDKMSSVNVRVTVSKADIDTQQDCVIPNFLIS